MEDREGESCRGAGGLICGCFGGDDLGEDRGTGGRLLCGGFSGDSVFGEDFLRECGSPPMFTHHVIQVDVAFA